MTKKTTTLKIDENILYLAKREIPNISQFVENCLKTYLNITNDSDNVVEMQDALNTIKDAKLKIHILSESENNKMKFQAFDTEKQNRTWRKIWVKYCNGEETSMTSNEAEMILGITVEEIVDMMDLINYPQNNLLLWE